MIKTVMGPAGAPMRPPYGSFAGKSTSIVTMTARAAAIAQGHITLNATAMLVGRSPVRATGSAAASATAMLAARSIALAAGRSSLTGSISLAARSAAKGAGRTVLSTAQFVSLFARSTARSVGFAAPSATAMLAARSTASASARSSLRGGIAFAARGAAQATGRATLSMAQIIAMFARGFVTASGRATPNLVAKLSAESTSTASGKMSTPGLTLRLAASGLGAVFGALYQRIIKAGMFGAIAPIRQFGKMASARQFGGMVVGFMPNVGNFSLMDVGEQVNGWLDLSPWLAPGETITTIVSVMAANYPQYLDSCLTLRGQPQIGTVSVAEGGSGVANGAVLQQWTGAARGTARITVTVLTSAGQKLIAWGNQPVH